ncbi:hypothetical protein [Ralstonia syzygii]|uniref:Cupin 2 conserved barrel domain-containing protein n=1 Tax=Ralstonia syzygii R24 TaxID=907261 RepID=G3A9W2_9RALS|nr:hypothetical protein [Ralstonia syzygii]CCA88089.1 conserved exported hypothetical protein [Ralstonia syzygii R24]
MNRVNRRSALAFVLTSAAASPAFLLPTAAAAERYRVDEGTQLAPGVRRVELSKRPSEIPAYATVSMVDLVFQPKSKFANPAMASDMVCHCLEGELAIDKGPGMQFVAKPGDVWTCKKGMPETTENRGSTVAIMRIALLLA